MVAGSGLFPGTQAAQRDPACRIDMRRESIRTKRALPVLESRQPARARVYLKEIPRDEEK